jgi:hypothetical protein
MRFPTIVTLETGDMPQKVLFGPINSRKVAEAKGPYFGHQRMQFLSAKCPIFCHHRCIRKVIKIVTLETFICNN